MQNVSTISELLKPFNPSLMHCYPVTTRINSVANDDEQYSRPVEIADNQDSLFA